MCIIDNLSISEKKLDVIQALRAFAAMLVVMNHYPGRFTTFAHGYVGVDLFFVISGLIMVVTTNTKNLTTEYAYDFLIKRFSRIVPYYAIMTIIALAVTYKAHDYSGHQALIHTIKSIILVPMWDRQPVLEPGWTLSFEMYFYFIFFLSLLFEKNRWLFLFSYFLLTLTILTRISLYRELKDISILGDYLNLFDTGIVWCFVFGVVIGKVFINGFIVKWNYSIMLVIISSMAILYIYFYTEPQHGPELGMLFAILTYSLLCLERRGIVRIPRFIIFLGDISFSIYLTQYITITIMERYMIYYFEGEVGRWSMLLPFLVSVISVGYISYRAIEAPTDSWCKKALRSVYGIRKFA